MADYFELTHKRHGREDGSACRSNHVFVRHVCNCSESCHSPGGGYALYGAVLTATVIVSAFTSILMGVYTNNPILVAPGMGINQLFVYAVSRSEGVPYEVALGCVFYAGLIFIVLMIIDPEKTVASRHTSYASLRTGRRDWAFYRHDRA